MEGLAGELLQAILVAEGLYEPPEFETSQSAVASFDEDLDMGGSSSFNTSCDFPFCYS